MKRAVSISLGSSKRNKTVEIALLGQTVRVERIGTDGDMEKAARLFQELDGQVDAFGVGGADLGLDCIFGDLMFGLGLPIPLRGLATIKLLAALLLPLISRLPFEWIYPIGEKQEQWTPKFERWYQWATVIAGDCHYIKRYRPARLDGKIICTNTTTPDDVEVFRTTGARWLVTTTPVLDGRSFGTNMIEAALIAVSERGRTLTDDELNALIDKLRLEPTVRQLN
jgi:hypothetical protein